MIILHFTGLFFILLGSIFLFLGGLGIFRMPDLYNRLQAGTKASTLGAMSLIIGVGILQLSQVLPDGSFQFNWFFKTLVIVIFIALSNPVSSHAIAKGAYKKGIKPKIDESKKDYNAYEDYLNDKEEEKL